MRLNQKGGIIVVVLVVAAVAQVILAGVIKEYLRACMAVKGSVVVSTMGSGW